MKNADEILKLDDERLEAIASDESIAVPHGLEENLRSVLAAERRKAVRVKRFALTGAICTAAIAAAACLVLIIRPITSGLRNIDPVFNTPHESYCCIISALERVGSGLVSGMELASDADRKLDSGLQQGRELTSALDKGIAKTKEYFD